MPKKGRSNKILKTRDSEYYRSITYGKTICPGSEKKIIKTKILEDGTYKCKHCSELFKPRHDNKLRRHFLKSAEPETVSFKVSAEVFENTCFAADTLFMNVDEYVESVLRESSKATILNSTRREKPKL